MSSSFSILSCLLIFSLIPLLSAARPCKTLFISYYTITTTTTTTADPTFTSDLATSSSSDHHPITSRFYAVYRIIPLRRVDRPVQLLLDQPAQTNRQIPNRLAAGISPSSLQDRAKDILIVVAGLLFGLGCGAITASTMYLVWSLLSGHDESDAAEYYSDSELGSPKKMGYVKIPAAVAVTKEGYEEGGNVISGN